MDPITHLLGELKGTVAGLASRIDSLVASLDIQREGLERRVAALEAIDTRVRSLEIWRGWLTGAIAALMAAGSYAAYKLFK